MKHKAYSKFKGKTINEMLKMQNETCLQIQKLTEQKEQLNKTKEKLFWKKFGFQSVWEACLFALLATVVLCFMPNIVTVGIIACCSVVAIGATCGVCHAVLENKFKKLNTIIEEVAQEIQNKTEENKTINQAIRERRIDMQEIAETNGPITAEEAGEIEQQLLKKQQERRQKSAEQRARGIYEYLDEY